VVLIAEVEKSGQGVGSRVGGTVNLELFLAFLIITLVLIITPGPIVTLVVATGATEGIRAALATVVGTVLGNALLVAAIAFGSPGFSTAPLFCLMSFAGRAPRT
jgi:homoserine/homoserine lactone efflux protein